MRSSSNVWTSARITDFIFRWSGATPYRTSPYGAGSRSITSTVTRGSPARSASAVYRPEGPAPITAILGTCVIVAPRRER